MGLDEKIKSAVEELTRDGMFQVAQIVCDEKNFGNMLVLLTSTIDINIRFIKDRGDIWCELSLSEPSEEWFSLSDVLAVLGVQITSSAGELIEMMTNTSRVIKQNLTLIVQAFDDKHRFDTRRKIKEFGTKRAVDMFGLPAQ